QAEDGIRDRNVTGVQTCALPICLKYVRRHLTHVFSTGVKPVYRLTLSSGKQIRATANHPFLTYNGWTQLGELEVGSRIGVPRHVPAPEQCDETRSGHQVVESAVALSGEREIQLRIPDWIFQLPKQQISLFLRAWWSAVGSVGEHGLALAPPSVAVADGLSRLLLRFGISAIITEDAEALSITGSDDVRRFLQEIGIDGRHSASAEALLRRVRSETEAGSAGAAGLPVWNQVGSALSDATASAEAAPMGTVATLLAEDALEVEAVNDVFWDTVTGVT